LRRRSVLLWRALAARDSVFRVLSRDTHSRARRSELHLARAVVETPAFMPVGTLGAVKGVAFDRLEKWDCRIILANTYHLMLRPGQEILRRSGGLAPFTGWRRAMLTDSGGFQVMSLAAQRRVTEDGVEFRSHLDGSLHRLTPERAMELQGVFGSDIAMALDVCPALPATKDELRIAVERTSRWARRCRSAWRGPGLLFGIIQGGADSELRKRSAAEVTALDFPGYAVGGVAVGESKEEMSEAMRIGCALLPDDRPRYLMGVGTPADILEGVREGVDLFDCVLPTRNGRMGHAYTRVGEIAIRNSRFADDRRPLDLECECPVCRRHSRQYLRHLFLLKDITAPVLLSVHNVYFYLDWMARIRAAISAGRLGELAAPAESKIPPG